MVVIVAAKRGENKLYKTHTESRSTRSELQSDIAEVLRFSVTYLTSSTNSQQNNYGGRKIQVSYSSTISLGEDIPMQTLAEFWASSPNQLEIRKGHNNHQGLARRGRLITGVLNQFWQARLRLGKLVQVFVVRLGSVVSKHRVKDSKG